MIARAVEASVVLAETPVWATVLVAALAGVFGLLSGAAAAAYVTTRHERTERFRERMIEAADGFVEKMIKTEGALRAAFEPIEDVRLHPSDEAFAAARWQLGEAARLAAELDGQVPRLFVVFRDEEVGLRAMGVSGALDRWRENVRFFTDEIRAKNRGALPLDTPRNIWSGEREYIAERAQFTRVVNRELYRRRL
jgi:hypothetical protein